MERHEVPPRRRLPIYILADTSGSMAGEAILALSQGLSFLKDDLVNEPRAVETVWLSVITFGGQAQVAVPLTELMAFTPPTLNAEGGTPLGGALRLLNQSIHFDVVVTSGKGTGDYKPLVFLFIHGEPTDDWRSAVQEIKQRTRAKIAYFVAVGCGDQVNYTTLKEITEIVYRIKNVTADDFRKLIRWIPMSVKVQ